MTFLTRFLKSLTPGSKPGTESSLKSKLMRVSLTLSRLLVSLLIRSVPSPIYEVADPKASMEPEKRSRRSGLGPPPPFPPAVCEKEKARWGSSINAVPAEEAPSTATLLHSVRGMGLVRGRRRARTRYSFELIR
ncbi:unnamed protein product [Linum trigynum]|uniref:Uncharacterized protein n=1 Tax=Linum trigynum TaxID=586398 RepID=A0AAV2EX56_9ROSI